MNDFKTIFNEEVIALILFTFFYMTYFFSNDIPFIRKINDNFNEIDGVENSIYFRRLRGFILLGILPLIIMILLFNTRLSEYGMGLPIGKNVIWWIILPTLFFTIGSFIKSSKTITLTNYPQIRKKTWSKTRIFYNSGTWFIYLLGYEILLRGIVFFPLIDAFGLWQAIIINCMLYSLIHIFKGYKEAYGSFFLGIVFCLIIYYTNSIWIVVFNHTMLAIINDIKAVKESNEMKFDW